MLKHCYFVDESGDLTLFDKRGRPLVGCDGVSKTFMVGVLKIPDPHAADKELAALRVKLLDDPYFQGVPSLRMDAGKTAMLFHAKDDAPEVRREVIRLIASLDCQVIVAIKRKTVLMNRARWMMSDGHTKLNTNDVYDELITRLFKNLLHKAERNVIVYARRGKAHRRDAFQKAIQHAKYNFERQHGITAAGDTDIECSVPSAHAGLQVIDYFLWAVQRIYERGEDRFFNALAQHYKLIMDLDDTRSRAYGEWYSKANPLALKKIMPLED